jgi:short-subunit dehydrogenase
VISVAYCIEAWLPKLKPNGSLVHVSSSAAFLPLPRASAYGSSKAAVSYLAKTLAVELPNHHVCLVSPGFVKTPLTDKNDFPMPFLVDVDKASAMIKKGISKRKSHIQFPFIFMMLMHLFSILPMSVWNKIARRTIKS